MGRVSIFHFARRQRRYGGQALHERGAPAELNGLGRQMHG